MLATFVSKLLSSASSASSREHQSGMAPPFRYCSRPTERMWTISNDPNMAPKTAKPYIYRTVMEQNLKQLILLVSSTFCEYPWKINRCIIINHTLLTRVNNHMDIKTIHNIIGWNWACSKICKCLRTCANVSKSPKFSFFHVAVLFDGEAAEIWNFICIFISLVELNNANQLQMMSYNHLAVVIDHHNIKTFPLKNSQQKEVSVKEMLLFVI